MVTPPDLNLLQRVSPQGLVHCSEMLRALAHPMRLAMVDLLHTAGPLNVTAIYERLGLEQSVASHHLAILRGSGLVAAERQGKNTLYRLAEPRVMRIVHTVEECQLPDTPPLP